LDTNREKFLPHVEGNLLFSRYEVRGVSPGLKGQNQSFCDPPPRFPLPQDLRGALNQGAKTPTAAAKVEIQFILNHYKLNS